MILLSTLNKIQLQLSNLLFNESSFLFFLSIVLILGIGGVLLVKFILNVIYSYKTQK